MARSSSSSSSSSGERGKKDKKKKGKKEKKEKKDKKDKKGKKDKKDKKAASKEAQARSRAAAWECDRAEAKRLVKSLLELDAEVAEELGAVFEGLDSGALVRLECVADKQARKKLRHLLQALRLEPAEGGFRSPCRKVAFRALFEGLLEEARGAAAGAPVPAPQAAAAAARQRARARYAPEPAAAAPPEAAAEVVAAAAPAPAPPAPPRRVGPQLPGASVGPAGGGDSESEREGEGGGEAGPKIEGEEREGLDLDMIIEEESKREAWMTMCPDGMSDMLGSGSGGQRDKYEVRRSTAEQKEFEEMFRARGPSLLQAQKNGDFADFEEERRAAAQKRVRPSDADLWGTTQKEQEQGSAQKRQQLLAPRKAFDPEKDLQQHKPMTADAFSKLVENSQSTLSGRFSRGAMATSFL